MKINIIGPTYPHRGGISHYNTLLCNHLSKNHDVHLLSFKRLYPAFLYPGGNQKDDVSKNMIKTDSDAIIDSINPLTWLKAFAKISKEKPDMLIFHWWTPFFTPVFYSIAKLTRIFTKTKILFICHNVLPHEGRKIDNLLTKLVLKRGNSFIVHSSEDYNNLKKLIPDANVKQTVHPTYDIFNFKSYDEESSKEMLGINNKSILFFGAVREYKGLKYLIAAMPIVLQHIDATLIIAGQFWEDRNIYVEQVKKCGIEDNVKIVDEYIPNEKVGLYMTAADIVVLPYISATQSGIIQIAYGFNKPVISTNVGGLPDVVKDGETGFLVDSANPETLAHAIVSYFNEGCEEVFVENIKKENERFSWDVMVKIIEEATNAY